MRDDNRRASAHHRFVASHNLRFRGRIERARCFIEHQHRRVGQKSARNGKTLPFAGRQGASSLANNRVQSFRHTRNQIAQAAGPHRFQHIGLARIRSRETNVRLDGGVEHKRILVDHQHVPTYVCDGERLEIMPVKTYRALFGIHVSRQQVGNSAFAHAAWPHNGHVFARLHGQAHVVEHRHFAIERKRHVVKRQCTTRRRHRCGIGRFDDFNGRIENFVHAPQRHARRGHAGVQSHQSLYGTEESHLIRHERDQRAHGNRAADHAPTTHEKHSRRAQRQQQPGQSARKIRELAHGHQRTHEAVVARTEAHHFAFLRVHAHHQLHRQQCIDQKRANTGALFAQYRDRRLQLAAIRHQRPQCHRQQRKTGREQQRIQHEQNDYGANEKQHAAYPGQRNIGGDPLNFTDVVVEPRYNLAQRHVRVESRR